MLPPRGFDERPIDISSSYDINDRYVPPEGDGVKSLLSKEGNAEPPPTDPCDGIIFMIRHVLHTPTKSATVRDYRLFISNHVR